MHRFILALLALVTAAPAALAQQWPQRPVTMIVPFAAGGATDIIGRVIAQKFSAGLGQQVLIDNKAGAGGGVGATAAANAAHDGYTLLVATSSTHSILPLTQKSLAYDPDAAFAPIGMILTAPNLLIVSPTIPVTSVAELIRYAEDNPGRLNFSSSGIGSITHLVGELFKDRTGINVEHVPYRSGIQALPELTSGQISFLFDSVIWSLPAARAGQVRALGITTAARSPLAPEIPPVAETVPEFQGTTWVGLVAPARTPEPVIEQLRQQLGAALASPDVRERLASIGAEPAPAVSAAYFRDTVTREREQWGGLIRKTGIQLQ